MADVAVIGAGAAGIAAAWSAADCGARVIVLDGGIGASGLYGGAADDAPWEQVEAAAQLLGVAPVARPLPEAAARFIDALGIWRSPRPGEPIVYLCTEAGRVRVARASDHALLDLGTLRDGARVLLPRAARQEWDADALARALGADPYARERRIAFEAVDAAVLKHAGEERIAAAELARLHDESARRNWLAERLRALIERHGAAQAILLGPWLGADQERAAELTASVGLLVGEVLGVVGGAAGLRFEAARTRLLARLGVAAESARATGITRENDELAIEREPGDAVRCSAVVLAIGGLGGGGVIFDAPERSAGPDLPARIGPAFRLSLAADVALEAAGRRIDAGSSMFGPALDRQGWPMGADPGLLERVGIACSGPLAAPGIFAAGDAVADRPRTMLEAVMSGVCAGRGAALHAEAASRSG